MCAAPHSDCTDLADGYECSDCKGNYIGNGKTGCTLGPGVSFVLESIERMPRVLWAHTLT
jgi:hypothetical protein